MAEIINSSVPKDNAYPPPPSMEEWQKAVMTFKPAKAVPPKAKIHRLGKEVRGFKPSMVSVDTESTDEVPGNTYIKGDKISYNDIKAIFDSPVVKPVAVKPVAKPSPLDYEFVDEFAEPAYEPVCPADNPQPPPNPAPIQVVAPAAQVPQPPLANQPNPQLGSLRAFVNGQDDFDGSNWTPDRINEALNAEQWRARDVEETIREGDLLCLGNENGAPTYDRVLGWKDSVITPELIELHSCTIYTLEGGGKKRKPMFTKTTADYENMFAVPKDEQLKLPTNEKEARRFFQCDVIVTEIFDKGRPVKCYYPMPGMMANRDFRRTFSRIFVEFAKRHFRDHIKGLIYGRGDGIHIKRNVSTKKIVDMYRILKDDPIQLRIEKISAKFNIPREHIADLLVRQNYGKNDDNNPLAGFMDRMNARALTPQEFKYDKALGIEIETVCPMSAKDAQARVPNYVRATYDGSLRNDKNEKMSHNGGNHQNELAIGLNGEWGVEFCILIKRSELETRLLRALESIQRLGCHVNKSCGLHVHFDMRDKKEIEVERLHQHLTSWLSVLRELLPASRRANKYCAFENPDDPHHAAVSIDAYRRHKTLEVRVHSSTLNNIKVIQWIRLIETIIETRFTVPPKTSTLDGLKALTLTEADRTFWHKRHQQLNPKLYKEGKLDLGFLGDNPNEDE